MKEEHLTENPVSEDFDELDFGELDSRKVDKAKVAGQIKHVEENLWEKLANAGKKISFAKDVIALFNYMRDPVVSWGRKAIIVAALIYFISPLDAMPDFAPFIGYLDDLGIITALLKFLGSELVRYYPASYKVS